MQVAPEFQRYFNGRLHQVFLYITDRCGLRCEQCLYKTTLANREMDLSLAIEFVNIFREYGAEKLTFIGGEPTMYGASQGNQPLFDVIDEAQKSGYKYIRLDTNGQSSNNILRHPSFQKLDNLSFSLDGHTAEINDSVRGKDTFRKCISMVSSAVDLGYYVSVTSCVHPGNLHHIDEMADFCHSLGVRELNLHPLFKMGIDRDDFSGDTDIDPTDWLKTYNQIRSNTVSGRYKIPVRAPQRFIAASDYSTSPETFNYCPVRMGERVLVHPNGEIRICALCIGSPIHIARYNCEEVKLVDINSEIDKERMKRQPCMSQVADFGDLKPLCISYKPYQNEYVWKTQQFDSRFIRLEEK